MLSDKIDARVMQAAGPRLNVISSLSAAVDHIDVKLPRGAFMLLLPRTYLQRLLPT